MQDVLEFVLKNIVTHPDEVKVEATDEQGTTNFIVTVHADDVGRIIGKEGKIIKAIRTIMRVIAIQKGVHVRVSVVSESENAVGSVEVVETESPSIPTVAEATPAPQAAIPNNPSEISVEV